MIIDYDHNPHLRFEQRLQSLKESVQMALSEIDKQMQDAQTKHAKDAADLGKKIDALAEAITALSVQITSIQSDITTINSRISALEAVAEDAITIDRSAE